MDSLLIWLLYNPILKGKDIAAQLTLGHQAVPSPGKDILASPKSRYELLLENTQAG